MSTTRQLLAAEKAGAEILHNGAPVVFDPRWDRDRKPWVWSDGATVKCRYAASQCQIYWPGKEG